VTQLFLLQEPFGRLVHLRIRGSDLYDFSPIILGPHGIAHLLPKLSPFKVGLGVVGTAKIVQAVAQIRQGLGIGGLKLNGFAQQSNRRL
jgi:hypothetical protein